MTGILTIAISTVAQGTRIVWEYNVGGSMRYEVPVISKSVDGVMGVQLAALAEKLGPVAMAASEPEPADDAEVSEAAAPADRDGKPPVGEGASTGETVKPAARPVSKPVGLVPSASAAKPAPMPASVDDAFGDLKDDAPDA